MGKRPTFYHLYSIWGAQMVDNGILAAPPEDVLEFINGTYKSSTVDAVTIDGTTWGVPTEVANYQLVYNKQLLEAAGAEVPSTWDELTSLAAEITERNEQGNITTAGYAFGPSTATVVHTVFFVLLYANGVQPFAEDFSSTNLASPEAIAVLEQQVELFTSGATDRSVEVWDFPSGNIAMMIMAPWFEADLEAGFGDAFADTVGVAPIPAGEGASMQYAFFYGVDANSDVQDEAWDFLTWLNTPQTEGETSCMGEMLVGLGALTSNEADIAAAQDELGDVYSAPFVAALDNSVTEPNVVQAAEIERVLQGYIERAWAGELTAEEALTQADAEISDILAEFY